MPTAAPAHGARRGGVLPVPRYSPGRGADAGAGRQAGVRVLRRVRHRWRASRAELADLMRTLTAGPGSSPPAAPRPTSGVGQPPSDSDVLGPVVPGRRADRHACRSGRSLFDDRYGLGQPQARASSRRCGCSRTTHRDPPGCTATCCCSSARTIPDTIHHAIRDITKHTRGAMQLRWRIDGLQLAAAARPARRATCSASRTAPPTRPGRPRQQPDLGRRPGRARPGRRAAPTRWCG